MSSNGSTDKFIYGSDQKKINRRTFFTKSVGCTAGLTLLAFPGIIAEVLAAKGDESKEEILKELEEKAAKYVLMYGCAQGSFRALNEQLRLNADDKTTRALMPFTGGIALRGETCGAVSGSLLAIGYYFESMNRKGEEGAGSSMKYGGMFFDRFTEEFGSTRCWEIQKHLYGKYYDTRNPEEMKLFMEIAKKSGKCTELVKKAVFIAGDIILKNA